MIAIVPGHGWRWTRRLTQLLTLVVIISAPLLGGWQRLDRTEMATWSNDGFDLPSSVRERLPLGERPKQAYRVLEFVGGGTAVSYFGVPAVDPVAGLAAVRGGVSVLFVIALLIPLAIGMLVGRWFCGWLCPFGTLSRISQAILRRLPIRPPRYRIPDKRPLRWLILASVVVIGALGVQLLTVYLLPHLLVQQSVYALWLLGGGGALLGALLGLLLAGAFFGPTLYCASLCPTGAALAAAGRLRVARLTLVDKSECGSHCTQCDRACWIGLKPSTGDPGPDCDLCARCVPVCPKTNMQVTTSRPKRKSLPVVVAALFMLPVLSASGRADAAPHKPAILLNGERIHDGVTIAVSVIDFTGVKREPDSPLSQFGSQLTVFIARGVRGPADARGSLPNRDVYRGKLTVTVTDDRGQPLRTIEFDTPTSPRSTPKRSLYRKRLNISLRTGDRVTIAPISNWTTSPATWRVPEEGTAPSAGSTLLMLLAAGLGYGGLLSLALIAAGRTTETKPSPT